MPRGGRRRGAGRKPTGRPWQRVVSCKVAPEWVGALDRLAAARGMTRNKLLVCLIEQALGKEVEE